MFLPPENFNDKLDFNWIDNKFESLKNSKDYLNVLLILDDVVADLKDEQNNKNLISLVFNRRHKLNNVRIYKF